jgi:alpha-beta hydrolase superfamily lysophospholipase
MFHFVKRTMFALSALFVLINVVACFHASKFTSFDRAAPIKTKDARELSFLQKLKTLLLGVNNPRPENTQKPTCIFQTVKLKSNKEIECWHIQCENSRGTVILFHGFSGEKSGMLDKAEIFRKLGYNTLLVDFMGSGGSEGDETTIGFYEAMEVRTAFDYIASLGETNIFLFGTSMGAVAIMKALNDAPFTFTPKGIIIECPFGTMLQTVETRFKNMNLPAFPMAHLLVFWGGVQNKFNAFAHNPVDYARAISCPTLLLYGQQDEKVSMEEINSIYTNLQGPKDLKVYPQAAHENYVTKYETEWTSDVNGFIESIR